MVPEKEDLLIYSNQSILSQKITLSGSACRWRNHKSTHGYYDVPEWGRRKQRHVFIY
jgi:hypothetical protein